MRVFIIILLLLLIPIVATPSQLYHPELKWYTIETEHFFIHYYHKEKDIVKVVAKYAEEAHRILTRKYNWEPASKTHIVVSETEDFANGMAGVFPYNTIYIYLIPPSLDSVIGFYDNWLYLLIVHEYTHIIQLDQARGPAGAWRYIFGRTPFTLLPPFTTFPNALMPEWLIEGLATYEESNLTSAGRTKSTLMNIIMESAVKENKMPAIGMGSGDIIEWPWHNFPYFYGSRFYKFLSDNFGEKALSSFQENYSKQVFPFMLNSNSSKVTGYPLKWLWNLWLNEEMQKYKNSVQNSTTNETQLTLSGYYTRGVRVSRDGRYLVYTKLNPSEYPSVYLYHIEGKKEKRLFYRNYGIDFSWAPDSTGFYFTQAEVYRTFYIYNDLYFYSMKDEKITRLTHGLRINEFDISPDGKKGVATIIKNGSRILVLIDMADMKITELDEANWEESSYNPRFSPDGEKIVYTRWSVYGFYEIVTISLKTLERSTLPIPVAFNIFPAWNLKGNGIFFSSDLDGTQRLYYYSLSDATLYKISEITRPVYEFDLSPYNAIYFTSYSASGFDIFQISFSQENLEKVKMNDTEVKEVIFTEIPDTSISEQDEYSGIKYVYPRFWMPLVFYSSSDGIYFNAMTANSDPLKTHSYEMSMEYFGKYNIAGLDLRYQNDMFLPSAGIHYSYLPVRYHDLENNNTYWWRENRGEIYITRLFRKFRFYFEPGLHYVITNYTSIDYPVKVNYTTAGAGATFLFYSAKKYSLSPGRQDGALAGIGFRRYSRELGSDLDFYKVTFDFREYYTITKNVVFAIRGVSAFLWGKLINETLTIGGVSPRMEDNIFGLNNNQFFLRGYPPDVDSGFKAMVFSTELRFPITTLDFGFDTLPFFIQKLHGSIFYESGDTWNGNISSAVFRDSVGGEIKFDSTAFYIYNITLVAGGAYGLKQDGIFEFYFLLGSSF